MVATEFSVCFWAASRTVFLPQTAPAEKQVFPDTLGTDWATRTGTVMGGYSTVQREII